MTFKVASVDSLIVEFDTIISLETSLKIKYYYEQLKSNDAIIDLVPSYTTLFITYDFLNISYEKMVKRIKKIKYRQQSTTTESKLFKVPVYYGQEVGLDLERIATANNITIDKVIKLHTQKEYHVYAIGFAPGFAYLGEVKSKIAMPRMQTPRKIVPKGSVAIADRQTAIYPQNSPGGWNIIGRTTFEMFDPTLKELSPVQMGDRVSFYPISKEEYLEQGGIL